ncbi:hypothetical protein [Longimicrobium sp.]|uniref:hypothetical protein n=1 Tax=Longimicrobium sp. TaxID=2029185 RepID=UPI003B3A00BB
MSTAVQRRGSTFIHIFAVLALAVLLGACGGGSGGGDKAVDPGRAKYEEDKKHCESVSAIEAAQKSCMTYRGWPDGKYRR